MIMADKHPNPKPAQQLFATLVPYGMCIGLSFIIAGIVCLTTPLRSLNDPKNCVTITKYKYESIVSVNYSQNCPQANNEQCFNSTLSKCNCYIGFVLPEPVKGDVVIAYRLPTFNETVGKDPKFYLSRDDYQLRGYLNMTPSPACHPFDYDEGLPIVPCGALADAMFNDTIGNIVLDTVGDVPSLKFGLLRQHEKKGFRNPSDEHLYALVNSTKPKNWSKYIWELDMTNPSNNAFKNEAFIVWMRPDLPIRPMWRLDRSANPHFSEGLPAGYYSPSIHYNYPYSLYSGPRILDVLREYPVDEEVCEEKSNVTQPISIFFGYAGLAIGCLLIAFASLGIPLLRAIIKYQKENLESDSYRSSRNSLAQVEIPSAHYGHHTIEENGATTLMTKPQAIAEQVEPEEKPLKENKDEEYL